MNAPLDAGQRASLEAALSSVTLDDKYTLERGRAYMSGIQALVRLPMLQQERDQAAGLNTAGFISGYRGSPLGGLDQSLWKAKQHLAAHQVVFQPGVNEDLAATAVWGSQQVNLYPSAKYDGVFSMWYGKGPGVDRSGDVFKHGNSAGSSHHGGVLVLAGDDHAAKSSTLAHQSEHIFKACGLPVLFPSNVQEYLDFGSARLGDEPLLRPMGRDEMRDRRGRIVGFGRHRSAPHENHSAGRLRDARRRPEHPLARSAARAGSASARLQVVRGARLRARQQTRPRRHRFAACALRHHDRRQGLSRRAPGAHRPRSRRRNLLAHRHPPVQGRLCVAARGARRASLRARPRRNSGGRRKAPDSRIRDQGRTVQLARCAASARVRQVRREGRRGRRMVSADGQLAAAGALRTLAGDHRQGDRHAARQVRSAVRRARAHRDTHRGDRSEGKSAGASARRSRAQAVVLLRLPAQHVDQCAGRFARDGRHRLPLHDGLDGPQHQHLQPDGRRRRRVDRPGAVHQRQARVRQSRRRHLLPLGAARDSRGDRVEGEHHLQDSL